MGRPQRTIENTADISGKALFGGQETTVRLRPAETGTGVLFVRTDLPDNPVVPATVEALSDGFQCTMLCWNEVQIRSPEHLLSACRGMGVDNLMVELDSPELPAGGGNAEEYARALQDAGIVDQEEQAYCLELDDVVSISEGDASIVAMPSDDGLNISYLLEFEDGEEPPQAYSFSLDNDSYLDEIAPARTFATDAVEREFRQRSIGGGVTDDNAVVVRSDGTVQKPLSQEETSLRFPEECARHKVLDLLGDLMLTNMDLQANIVAIRSGHDLNAAFAKRLSRLREEKEAGPEEYLDIREIQKVLPHRYPFLMVDRVLDIIEEENKIIGVKNVSMNEQYFQG
ncbi:MAG: UDP-3-O-acyl-N-acetylglucosamine deacetylase, partial [Planctomycetota bacterium]